MDSGELLALRDAYLAHDGEWVVMELGEAERGEDWEQTGVVVHHGDDEEEAHAVARAHFEKSSQTDAIPKDLVVFQGNRRLMPGDHFRRICESIAYRRGPEPIALELQEVRLFRRRQQR